MNNKQKLTALFLALSLSAGSSTAAFAGPASQFGFKGWPYRRNGSCTPVRPTAAPAVVCTPMPAPTAAPASKPALEATAVPTSLPAGKPTPSPAVQPTAVPGVSPTAKPVPTAAPEATKAPQKTQKPHQTPAPPSTDEDYTTPSISAQEENAFLLLNQDRIANGRTALTMDPALCEIARAKSRDMAENHYFAHTSPTYGSAAQMLGHFGYAFTSVAENIAHHATVEKSQAAFMSSDGHRRNILGSQWSKAGVGVWHDEQGFVYVTQLFVR